MTYCQQLSNSSLERNWTYPDPEADNAFGIRITMAVFLIAFVAIAMPCNILVIGTIIKKRLFKQPTVLLFLNLLLTTVVFCIVHLIPFGIVTAIAGEFILGNTDYARCIVCYIDGVLLIILSIEIGSTIILISVDRFVYLYKPLKYSGIITIRKTIIAIGFAWIYSFVFSIPLLFEFGKFKLAGRLLPVCIPRFTNEAGLFDGYWWLLIFGVILPLVFLGVIFNLFSLIIIFKNIRKSHQRSKALSTTNKSLKYSNIQKQQILLFHIFGTLLVANMFIYIPVVIYVAVLSTEFLAFLNLLHIAFNSQAVVHSVVQALFIKDARNIAKKILCCLSKKSPSSQCCGCGCMEACNAAVIRRESE